MKKVICLIALVLAMSSTTWGICGVTVRVSQPADGLPVCGDDVAVRVVTTCSGACTFDRFEKSQLGNTLYVDMYLDCSCMCGSSEINKGTWILQEAPCGLYIVVVRVWCTYDCWPYCMFNQPLFCGMGSTYFKVCCPECGCYPCCCWTNPCCPTAVVAEETP